MLLTNISFVFKCIMTTFSNTMKMGCFTIIKWTWGQHAILSSSKSLKTFLNNLHIFSMAWTMHRYIRSACISLHRKRKREGEKKSKQNDKQKEKQNKKVFQMQAYHISYAIVQKCNILFYYLWTNNLLQKQWQSSKKMFARETFYQLFFDYFTCLR